MKSHTQKTSVLIADDHELLRESLALILGRESSIDIVGAVSDGHALLKAVATLRPAVVMMDLALPRINGIEAARRIREAVPGTGVIILSAHDRAEYMKEFLKEDSAGKAYLLKESLSSTRDLVRTIQDVAVGRTVLDPVMVSKLTSAPNVQINSSLKGLTSRELQVLSHMAQANSNRSIAEALYIQPRTVEHHISSILAKLGFNANGELHGRVHAVLTYLDATGQLPLKRHDPTAEADEEHALAA